MTSLITSAKQLTTTLMNKGMVVLDRVFPPEKRAIWMQKIQAFVLANPKVSAFLLTHIALTGLPLLLFALFTLTVFVFSLVIALLVGLLVALAFTALAVGTALLFLFPTVFFTTMAATFIFLWGLGGYYLLKWFNESPVGDAGDGEALGDKLGLGQVKAGMEGLKGEAGAAGGGGETEKLLGGGGGGGGGSGEEHEDGGGEGEEKKGEEKKSGKKNGPEKLAERASGDGAEKTGAVKEKAGGATGAAQTAKGVVS